MMHTTYSVAEKTVDALGSKYQVYTLQQDGKAVAEIAPALGNNCYAFKVADGDVWINLIDPPPGSRHVRKTSNRLRQPDSVPLS